MPRGGGEATRGRLLDAAARVLLRDPSKLTLDAVAEEAGTSKGGLLYHFKNKHDLLDAVIDRWEARFQDEVEAAAAADPTPGGWTRAYTRACAVDNAADAASREIDSGLVAAFALQPDRLEVARGRYAGWQARIEDDGLDPVDATIVRLAVDGLWLLELMDLGAPTGDLRDRVVARLLELAASPENQRPAP